MEFISLVGARTALREAAAVFRDLSRTEGSRSNSLTLAEKLGRIDEDMSSIQDRMTSKDALAIENLARDVEDTVFKYMSHVTSPNLSAKERFSWLKGSTSSMFTRHLSAPKFPKEIEDIQTSVTSALQLVSTSLVEDKSEMRNDVNYPWPRPGSVKFGLSPTLLVEKILAEDPGDDDAVISIAGMAGIGKTTLAREVYLSVRNRHGFTVSAEIYVGQCLDKHRFLQQVARQVRLPELKSDNDLIQEDLETRLHQYLLPRKYIIWLDNLLDSRVWDHLAKVIDGNSKTGSRIITTSRQRVLSALPKDRVSLFQYDLQPLDKEMSETLFCTSIVVDESNVRSLQPIENKIVGKCGGVPLAILDAAYEHRSTMAFDQYSEEKLERMGLTFCSIALFSSYKILPIPVSSCLLYFGLFPADYCFSASDIIRLWIAEGFLKAASDPENEGESCLKTLEKNSLIQVSTRTTFDGKIRKFCVHDIVRRFCVVLGNAVNLLAFQRISNSPTGVCRVAVSNWREISHQPPTLRTALCFQRGLDEEVTGGNSVKQQVEAFFKGSRFLRVLQVGSNQLPSFLTKDIGCLTLLRYLGTTDHHSWLSSQVNIPSSHIDKLQCLETLDLRSVECEAIPDEIWRIETLRHVLLRKPSLYGLAKIAMEKGRHRSSNEIKVKLPNLLTLYVFPGQHLRPRILGTSTRLRKLGVFFPRNTDKEVAEQVINSLHLSRSLEILWFSCEQTGIELKLSPYRHIARLHLRLNSFSDTIALPLNLVKLVLVLETVDSDQLERLKQLEKLKILKLHAEKSCSAVGIVCRGGTEAFPELQVLELYLPFTVRKLTVEEFAMPKLKELSGLSKKMLLEAPQRIISSLRAKRNLPT